MDDLRAWMLWHKGGKKMSDTQFHETSLGKRFYAKDVPDLIKVLERIADALEKRIVSLEKITDTLNAGGR